jgi:alpha-ketoglutarate-dependent taurine dioxygenase
MAITFSPIEACAETQPFAECHGIDLSRDLPSDTIEQIRQGLLRHGLLLFRDQGALSPEREVAFNRAFGWHDADQDSFIFGFGAPTTEHKVSGGAQIPRCPQVSVLGNVLLEDYHGIVNTQLISGLGLTYSGWHADGLHDMFDGMPEMTTMFNPAGWQSDKGGETYFASGVRALERMDPSLRQELEQCVVAYARCPNDDAPDESRRITTAAAYMADEGTRRVGWAVSSRDPAAGMADFVLEPEHAVGGGRHRCIRVHPVTGEASLYVTPSRAVQLLDAETGAVRHDIDETATMLGAALLPGVLPGVRYEHIWREGDFVAWLNTLVLHSATDPTDTIGDRLLHRVRLSAPKSGHQADRQASL